MKYEIAEIEATLAHVFSLPFVMAGRSEIAEQDIRFLTPEVAIVHTSIRRKGQLKSTGELLGVRDTAHLREFLKREGIWQIVGHLISDARERE